MAEYAIQRAGNYRGAQQPTAAETHGNQRSPTESHGALKVLTAHSYPPYFARFPHFRLLVFFSPLPFPTTPAVATNGRPFETTDMLRARRWGKRPRMEECRRNVLAIGPDIGATGTTSNRGTPRDPKDPHGTPRSAEKGKYAPKSAFFLRVSRIPVYSFSSLLSPLSQHLPLWQMGAVSKPPTC